MARYLMRGILLVMLLCQAGARAATPAAPTLDEVRTAVEARAAAITEVRLLLSSVVFSRTPVQPDQLAQWSPDNARSLMLHWTPAALTCQQWHRDITGSVEQTPYTEIATFSHQTFDRRAESGILNTRHGASRKSQVFSQFTEPKSNEAWIAYAIGTLWPSYRGMLGHLLDDATSVEVGPPVDDQPTVVLVSERSRMTLVPAYGYAPVLREYTSRAAAGGELRGREEWLEYRRDDATGLWWPRHTFRVVRFASEGGGPIEPQTINVSRISDLKFGEAAQADRAWPAEIPLFVGGVFYNRLSGQPADLTTYGPSLDALHEMAYKAETPLGLTIPELAELPRRAMPGPPTAPVAPTAPAP